MENKQKSLVSEKVYDYTMYNHGQYRHYISLSALKLLIEQICELNECPQYLRITPFFEHCKSDFGIEFDEYMCYIESTSENITLESVRSFQKSCAAKNEFEKEEYQYNLVNRFDVTEFHASLWRYMEFLYSLIPRLAKKIQKSRNLSDAEMSLGEFCFEVHCK